MAVVYLYARHTLGFYQVGWTMGDSAPSVITGSATRQELSSLYAQ